MADKFTAAESIRRIAAFITPMLEAAEQLETMGKAEQTIKEAEKAKETALADAKAAQQEAVLAKDEVKKAKDQAKEILNKATDQALIKLGEADQKAQAILDGAAAQANGMVLRAAAEANDQLAGVAGKVGQLTAEKTKLEDHINVLNAALLKLQVDGEEAEKKLLKIQAAIAKYAQVG